MAIVVAPLSFAALVLCSLVRAAPLPSTFVQASPLLGGAVLGDQRSHHRNVAVVGKVPRWRVAPSTRRIPGAMPPRSATAWHRRGVIVQANADVVIGTSYEVTKTLEYNKDATDGSQYTLAQGIVGKVEEIDEDGDAYLDFGVPLGHQWVLNTDHCHLKRVQEAPAVTVKEPKYVATGAAAPLGVQASATLQQFPVKAGPDVVIGNVCEVTSDIHYNNGNTLVKGSMGMVEELDGEGDALLDFGQPLGHQWVLKKDLGHLKRVEDFAKLEMERRSRFPTLTEPKASGNALADDPFVTNARLEKERLDKQYEFARAESQGESGKDVEDVELKWEYPWKEDGSGLQWPIPAWKDKNPVSYPWETEGSDYPPEHGYTEQELVTLMKKEIAAQKEKDALKKKDVSFAHRWGPDLHGCQGASALDTTTRSAELLGKVGKLVGIADFPTNIPLFTPLPDRRPPTSERSQQCYFDYVHRVCAQLLDDNGEPLHFSGKIGDEPIAGNFWEVTNQKSVWKDEMHKNGGNNWCISMEELANMVVWFGCDKVNVVCAATDWHFIIEDAYPLGLGTTRPLFNCLKAKCAPEDYKEPLANFEEDAGFPMPKFESALVDTGLWSKHGVLGFIGGATVAGGVVFAAFFFSSRLRQNRKLESCEQLLG